MAANPTIPQWKRDIYAGKAPLRSDYDELIAPIYRKKPSTIAVQFMGDWLHEDMFSEYPQRIISVMLLAPKHRYLLLTKRADRLVAAFSRWEAPPQPNWWVGVSVSTQEEHDEQWPNLASLKKAGWHTWLSVEPMLEPICLTGTTKPDWIAAGPETGRNARPLDPDAMFALAAECCVYDIPFYDKRDPSVASGRELP